MTLSAPLFAAAALLGSTFAEMGKWDGDFDYSTYLEENQQFRLYWSNLGDDLIEFGIEANSTGYIALGLSPDGGMKNSDIMLGWVDDDGVHLEDRFTDDSLSAPQLDATQNLELVEGEQEDGVTRIHFTRSKSNACDADEDEAVTIGTSRVIYAWNNADPIDGEPVYHGAANRGSQSVNLDGGQAAVVELEDDVESFELLMDEWPVAYDDDTEYVCRFLPMPEFDEKQHIVMIEAVVQPGNEGTVHHMVLYMCPEEYLSENVTFGQEVCDEWETNMPSPDCRFSRIEFAWAIGGTAMYFPEDAGMPFGGDHEFKYAFLEMHYDNPELREDIVDSSGLRLYHTPTLREYDLGVITLGHGTESLLLPPGIDALVTGSCSSSCTSQFIPEEGAIIFGNGLHTHTVGAYASLRHIRDGQELAPIALNENYDFDYQQLTALEEERKLMPGDELIMHCGYDTTTRDDFTFGGESSAQEMCFSFLFVYPVPDLNACFDYLSEAARSAWAQDMYEAGYLAMNETTLSGIIDDPSNDVTQFGDITEYLEPGLEYWYDYLGVTWNDLGDGTAMYNKLYSQEAYAGRSLVCNYDFYDHELADFVEYEADEVVCSDDEDSAVAVVGRVGSVVVLIMLASVAV